MLALSIQPLPKSIARPRLTAPRPPPPNHPPPTPIDPEMRSRKRRIVELTTNILESEGSVEEVLRQQSNIVDQYDKDIRTLETKIYERDHQIQALHKTNNYLNKLVTVRNVSLTKKTHELMSSKAMLASLRNHIDSMQMRIVETEQTSAEKITHYKELAEGLKTAAAGADESAQFICHIKKILTDYSNGETVEHSMYKTERLCTICLTVPANVCLKPCHHLEFCHNCASKYFSTELNFDTSKTICTNLYRKTCPRCSKNIERIDYLFL